MTILKLICLFLTIWIGSVTLMRTYCKTNIPGGNFIILAIGLTGFIYLQWLR